jgi:hypothetical protein
LRFFVTASGVLGYSRAHSPCFFWSFRFVTGDFEDRGIVCAPSLTHLFAGLVLLTVWLVLWPDRCGRTMVRTVEALGIDLGRREA